MGKLRPLPGRMTKLDVPQPIVMDVNRIGDDFDIVSIVTNEIGENRADKGLHTAAGGGERLVRSAPLGRARAQRARVPRTSTR